MWIVIFCLMNYMLLVCVYACVWSVCFWREQSKRVQVKPWVCHWGEKQKKCPRPVSRFGRGLAQRRSVRWRLFRLRCRPGLTSLPAFCEITAGTEELLPLPQLHRVCVWRTKTSPVHNALQLKHCTVICMSSNQSHPGPVHWTKRRLRAPCPLEGPLTNPAFVEQHHYSTLEVRELHNACWSRFYLFIIFFLLVQCVNI